MIFYNDFIGIQEFLISTIPSEPSHCPSTRLIQSYLLCKQHG